MNVGSLFSGIGGLDLGLERAGMRIVWQVESDPYARAVLRKHWPDVPCFEDVREVGAGNLVPVDLICGGFPCQDISNAGKRVGIDGERSGLWGEYARIVRELRPSYVLVENVAAILGRGLERVVGDLAACGYDAEWDCLPAAAVGAPHLRDRLFLVAYAVRDGRLGRGREEGNLFPQEWSPEGAIKQRHRRQRGTSANGSHSTDADAAGERWREGWSASNAGRQAGAGGNGATEHVAGARAWPAPPDIRRMDARLPSRVDRLRCLGNAVVPQIAEYLGRLILAHAGEAMTARVDAAPAAPEIQPKQARLLP